MCGPPGSRPTPVAVTEERNRRPIRRGDTAARRWPTGSPTLAGGSTSPTRARRTVPASASSSHGRAVAGEDDGGSVMCPTEIDTAVRLSPSPVLPVHDGAYRAAARHVTPGGASVGTAASPDTDGAAIRRGPDCSGVTVQSLTDPDAVRDRVSVRA